MRVRRPFVRILALTAMGLILLAAAASAEVMLQFFNNSWTEIIQKIPEVAETGYTSLWLPPPQKASGDLSVGYDLWDPFDLGGNPQRTGGRTRYGTEEELLRLISTAHRFGLRVYFDNIMNHRAFDIPGYNENTPIDIYPGMLPEDFHLRVTEEGFYRPWPDTQNWGNTWQVQNQFLSGLIDIAHETPNANFGPSEGWTHTKISFVRHPNNPEFYDFHPTGYVGFGSASITTNLIAENPDFFKEDVGGYLMRSIRWLVHHTKLDGLRLDAVKHVPAYFFGNQWDVNKDASDDGYCGQAQRQFNLTRGYSDANHRDTLFDCENPRDDLMIFGEHMGEPPAYGDYFAAGMRLLDAKTHSTLNNIGWSGDNMPHLEHSGYVEHIQFGKNLGVYYAKSHDDDVAMNEHLHYAINLTRAGLPNIYTDGNRQAETLGESGGAFPRHANTRPFGQFGDNRIPNLVQIHNSFARGEQIGRRFDENVVAYERRDKRENSAMTDGDATVLFFMMSRNYSSGEYREIDTTFPNGAILWQYADGGGKFYHQVTDGKIKVIVPPAGYFAFSWRSPEESELWRSGGGKPITVYSDGNQADWISYVRRDGPDGDEEFNPHGLPNRGYPDGVTPEPHTYTYHVPRVTSPTNIGFVARVDGSAFNVLFKLNGGMQLNDLYHSLGDPRDNPPALSTDVFLGYEQSEFIGRIGPEKFASVETNRNKIGSAGAETYVLTVGEGGFTINESGASNDGDGTHTAVFVYHDPRVQTDDGLSQFYPAPENAADQDIWFQVKTGHQFDINKVFVYYTTDGVSWPEGAGGQGIGNTKVVELYWRTNLLEGGVINDWWGENFIPAQPSGTVIRYKIGAVRWHDAPDSNCVFPNSWDEIARKVNMMGAWQIQNFNPSTVVYRPHNDYGTMATGLVEGFNFIQARAFLRRDGAAEGNGARASIYNTFGQTFYYDASAPAGEVVHPSHGETLWDNRYGVVVRTDPTVVQVWYNIQDNSALNDDGQTGSDFGNGTNAVGQTAWVEAQRVNPSIQIDSEYPVEWRFNYVNVPAGSTPATIRVKLAEYSSSTNPALSDAAGRFTTLERAVTANGPDYSMYVAWPQRDGDRIGCPYDMKVHFSKAMANWDEAVTRSRFRVSINGLAQDRDLISFNYDIDDKYHEMVFPLPDLWNGDPSYDHEIEVVHTNAGGGGLTLYAERRVKANQSSSGPSVMIINPPEFDLNGARYEIVLPDVSAPNPNQRRHNVRVQTGQDVVSMSIAFTNSTGFVSPVPSSTNALTGTVAVTAGSQTVTGTGTLFHEELSTGSVIVVGTNRLIVAAIQSSNLLTIASAYPGPTQSAASAHRIEGNPTAVGNSLFWNYDWTNIEQGVYTLIANADTDGNPATAEASAQRTTRVVFREIVPPDDDDDDDDDDGVPDALETTPETLPETNPETWTEGEVHLWLLCGRTDALSPDSDGDGLPDGLELGWEGPMGGTDTTTDTNGDGWPNFLSDRDPPVFNTTDNWAHPRYNLNRARTDQISGSMTDANKADADGDQLDDSVEDLNRNGRVDVGLIDGGGVVTGVLRGWDRENPGNQYLPTVYNSSRVDRDSLPGSARFLETDPNNPDTDEDEISDGAEDTNSNMRVDMLLLYPAGTTTVFNIREHPEYLLGMDAASASALAAAGQSGIVSRAINYDALFDAYGRPRRVDGVWQDTNKWPRILLVETDPLNPDTSSDGLPDGWKTRYGLDPWDDGWYNLRTGQMHLTNSQQGADGDLTGDGVNNWQHYLNGTDPRVDVNIPVPVGSITVGQGPVIGQLGGSDVHEEFMEWTWDDLRALDYYQGDGPNSKQGDVFRGWDGFDESRDFVAFYTRDGGAVANGGDDKFYFRVDMYDLQAHAEDEHLDLYVVIDTGNTQIGERVLPDQVDTLTDMRWELVVAVYNWSFGQVYLDGNPSQNTSTFSDDLSSHGGVVGVSEYFLGAYFNAELDAIEFAIDRRALLDVNWNGNPSSLNFQVFSTKPGTCNGCNDGGPGGGDIGGRSDIRDSIYNDYIAEDDHWGQAALKGDGSVLRHWIPGGNRPNRAKVSTIVHGNQAIQPGSIMQQLVNDGEGAGYYRVLDAHSVFGQPLNMHITPTLASALQWAKVDPAANKPWRDGPSLNARIGEMIRTNLVTLMASTFSDHMMPYFTTDFIRDNEALAREFLETIYETTITTNAVFWAPERLLDADVFGKISALGYRATVLDQMEHLFYWFGRNAALGNRGYQINRINGVKTFAVNNGASDFRFANNDGGLNMPLRRLLNRKARGDWDQVVVLLSNWEDFTSKELADAYDRNVKWIANRPWIKMVTLQDVLENKIDLTGDGNGDSWYVEERGALGAGQGKLSHNYINYSSRRDYDNWYLGSSQEEGLSGKVFEIRPGVAMPSAYGMLYSGGVVSQAWEQVRSATNSPVGPLARGVMHASVFQTAFHDQGEGDMAKFSNGEYISPDSSDDDLSGFAKVAQAQTRMAAMYQRVALWAASASSITQSCAVAENIDLDGESEYLLYNRRVLAVFERVGGRMVAAWVRDHGNGEVYQTVGNLLSYAGSETELEGECNAYEDGRIGAYRTSALKDWWAGTSDYVNQLYSFTNMTNGWRIASADNKIVKTVVLSPDNGWMTIDYTVDGSLNGGTLYVRNGLSPDLYGMLLHGQRYLGQETHDEGTMTLAHAGPEATVSAMLAYGSSGHNASFNLIADDENQAHGVVFDTLRMRNQAQTHQVEVSGTGSFSFGLGFEVSGSGVADADGDGIPDWWEEMYFGSATGATATNMAANGVNTVLEAYIAGLDPMNASDTVSVAGAQPAVNGIVVRFLTKSERDYLIWYADNNLMTPTWYQTSTNRIQGTGDPYEWTDDGTETNPHPLDDNVTNRFYRIEVMLPE